MDNFFPKKSYVSPSQVTFPSRNPILKVVGCSRVVILDCWLAVQNKIFNAEYTLDAMPFLCDTAHVQMMDFVSCNMI